MRLLWWSPFCLVLLVLSPLAPSDIPANPVSAEPHMFLAKWGGFGAGEGQFKWPLDVAVDLEGNIFVADRQNDRIQMLDSGGTFVRMWGWGVDTGANQFQICTGGCQAGVPGAGNGQFDDPFDLAVDAKGNVFVADSGNDRIQKFDRNGNYLLQWGSLGTSNDDFHGPRTVAVSSSGQILVGDTVNHRVKKHNGVGTFLQMWGWGVLNGSNEYQTCAFMSACQVGLPGSGNGQFNATSGVADDALGNVYVTDGSNARVQKFSSTAAYLTKWGTPGSGDGQFELPSGVAVDMHGNVYVVETNNHRVQRFNSGGTFLGKWGTEGSDDGQFQGPSGVAIDADGNVYVADTSNHRIQKFGPALDFFIANEEPGGGR